MNMPNTQQNNETAHINKKINLLQDRLEKNEKDQDRFQNGLMQFKRKRVKKGQRTNLSQTKIIQNIAKNIFQNKIDQIKNYTNLLQNILTQVKNRKRLFEKGLKKIAKMQNISQNELNQIAEMRGQPRDELERIAKIKNYEEMSREELIISLLKSKQSIAKLFDNNLYDNKIIDIRRTLNRLRDILPKRYRKEIKEKLYEIEHKENLSEAEKEENGEYLRKLVRILNNKKNIAPMIVMITIG